MFHTQQTSSNVNSHFKNFLTATSKEIIYYMAWDGMDFQARTNSVYGLKLVWYSLFLSNTLKMVSYMPKVGEETTHDVWPWMILNIIHNIDSRKWDDITYCLQDWLHVEFLWGQQWRPYQQTALTQPSTQQNINSLSNLFFYIKACLSNTSNNKAATDYDYSIHGYISHTHHSTEHDANMTSILKQLFYIVTVKS